MADSTRIEELLSAKSIKDFDELKLRVDASVASVEQLTLKAVQLNTALGGANTPKDFNKTIKQIDEAQESLIQSTRRLALEQSKLNNLAELQAKKIAIQEEILKQKELGTQLKANALAKQEEAKATKQAAIDAKLKADQELKASRDSIAQAQKEADIKKAALAEREAEESMLYKIEAAEREKKRISDQLESQREKEKAYALKLIAEQELENARKVAQANKDADDVAKIINSGTLETLESLSPIKKNVDELSASYDKLAAASIENQKESKNLTLRRKELDKSFSDGKISQAEYTSGLKSLKTEQATVAQKGTEINTAFKSLSKSVNSTVGSINSLRAALGYYTQYYDALSKKTRESDLGKETLKKIQSLTEQVTAAEEATGRFQRNVGNYGKAFEEIGSSLNDILSAAGLTVGLSAVVGFVSDAIAEFNTAEQAASRFKSILDNVGRSDVLARLSSDADDLADSFGFLDNDDVINVFQKLVTYGKLTENQIKQLTPVIIDFASKQGVSLEDASSVIIKALEGNNRGLKEYGINIKEAKTTTESFGIIMTELKPKVDGAAAAFGETLAGSAAKAKQDIANLKEEIGTELQPVVKGFYSFITEAIKGIPQFLDTIVGALPRLTGKILDIGKQIAGFVSFGTIGTSSEDVRAQEQKNLALERQAQLQLEISGIVKDASSKSASDRDKIINDQIALTNASQKAYDILVKAGRSATTEGKRISEQLKRDVAVSNALLNAFDGVDKSNEVIGGGDPNEKFNATAASNEKIKAVNKKFFDEEIKDQITNFKELSKISDVYLSNRLDARKRANELEKQLLAESTASQLANEQEKLDAVKSAPNVSANGLINAQNEFNQKKKEIDQAAAYSALKIEIQYNEDIAAIRNNASAKQKAADKADNDAFIKSLEDRKKAELDAIASRAEREVNGIDADRDNQLRIINDTANARIEAAKGNSDKITKIEKQAALDSLQVTIDAERLKIAVALNAQQQLLAIAKKSGSQDDISKLTAKIKELEKQLSELTNKELKLKVDVDSTGLDKVISTLEKISDIYGKLSSIVSDAFQANATAEKNQIQDQIDLLDQKTKTEIDGVNATTASEQDKAAKIAIINARTDAQKRQYELRQRQVDERKAQFDKAAAIGQIIIQTALAVTKALPVIPLAVLAGALGAAQLAVAIATPIPHYETGTTDAKGGWSLVGEKRKELVVTPEGRMIETPGTPTIMNIPKHSIVFPDSRKLMEGGIGRREIAAMKRQDRGELFYMLGGKMDKLGRIIKDKTETHFHQKGGNWEKIKKSGGNTTRYIS